MKHGKLGGVITALVILIGIALILACTVRIPAGYVGVVYSPNGGVQDEVLTQGWKVVNPINKVVEFTVGNEILELSKGDGEDAIDNSFAVSTSDNANIDISFQMTYRFIEGQVVDTYKNFRGMDGERIVMERVRPVLKAKISEVTNDYTMMEIYSGNRDEINKKLQTYLNEEFGKAFGIEVRSADIVDVHPDAQLQQTINDRVTAMQKKQQAEAEQETIRVQNETKLLEAQAEADAKKIAAEGEAEANRIVAQSITEGLLQKMEMEARLEHGWITVNGANTVVTN